MPRAVSAPSSRMRRAVPPPAADSHANTPAVEAVAKAVTISASRTPPTCASSGSATAPIVPPIGTASWRQPSAIPRRSGGNWRSRLLMPATGTAEEPMPARKMAAANRAALGATEAARYAQKLMVAPARSTGRAPKRSTSMPAGISATAEPRPTAANTAPNPAGPRPNLFWMSTPMAGRPNCTTETAAWAMTAMISVVRGRGLIATRYPGLGECMLGPVSAIERTRCPICASGQPLDVIAELDAVWVSAPPVAVLPGYACVVARRHVEEPFQLPDDEMFAFWRESMAVARALSSLLEPRKMNYEIHGNSIPHLHLHLYPRFAGDPFEGRPIAMDAAFLHPHGG